MNYVEEHIFRIIGVQARQDCLTYENYTTSKTSRNEKCGVVKIARQIRLPQHCHRHHPSQGQLPRGCPALLQSPDRVSSKVFVISFHHLDSNVKIKGSIFRFHPSRSPFFGPENQRFIYQCSRSIQPVFYVGLPICCPLFVNNFQLKGASVDQVVFNAGNFV